jgi:hypothetical protein
MTLSSYESERLRQFYGHAVRCAELAKSSGWRFSSWICRKVGKPCSARICPQEDFGSVLFGKPEVESLEVSVNDSEEKTVETPQVQVLNPASIFFQESRGKSSFSTTLRSEAVKTASSSPAATIDINSVTATRKSRAKTHSRPQLIPGSTIRRALVTFAPRTGEVQRWGVDCIFALHIKKPAITEFKVKRVRDARFYFPLEADDETVKTVINDWFEKLQVGSCTIEILDEVKG